MITCTYTNGCRKFSGLYCMKELTLNLSVYYFVDKCNGCYCTIKIFHCHFKHHNN